jgi:undecaprenyl pyrophosphate synthase
MAYLKVLLNTESGEVEIVVSKKVEDALESAIEDLEEVGFSEDAAHVFISNKISEALDEFEVENSIETEEYDDDEDEDDILFVIKYTAESEDIIDALKEIVEEAEEYMDDPEEDEDEDN